MDYEKLGNNVKKIRKERKITQERLAEMIDCSTNHVKCIENAKRVPSIDILEKIAKTLNTTFDKLTNDSYSNPELLYLKEVEEKLQMFSNKERINICEGILEYVERFIKMKK